MQEYLKRFHYLNECLPYITGVGLSEGGQDYYWDNRLRTEELLVFQCTLKGTGYLKVGAEEINLTPEKGFLGKIPGDFSYYGTDWQFFFIEFSPEFFAFMAEDLLIFEEVSHLLMTDFLQFIEKSRYQEFDLFENSQEAFLFFLRLLKEKRTPQKTKASYGLQLKSYLDEHYQEALDLEKMGEVFQLSRYQVIYYFKKEVGITPIQYLTKLRIQKSLALLQTSLSVEEVATKVGYENGNYFAKVFRKMLHYSPMAYRASLDVALKGNKKRK